MDPNSFGAMRHPARRMAPPCCRPANSSGRDNQDATAVRQRRSPSFNLIGYTITPRVPPRLQQGSQHTVRRTPDRDRRIPSPAIGKRPGQRRAAIIAAGHRPGPLLGDEEGVTREGSRDPLAAPLTPVAAFCVGGVR